jgi:mono/diheme cytochrome c family protein
MTSSSVKGKESSRKGAKAQRGVVGWVECNEPHQTRAQMTFCDVRAEQFSRKGAKPPRRKEEMRDSFFGLPFRLCGFAPLREICSVVLCRLSRLCLFAISFAVLLVVSGCQQKMAEQPSERPLRPSSFFADGRSARDPVPGTVAQDDLRLDRHFETGLDAPPPESKQGTIEPSSSFGGIGLPVARDDLGKKPYFKNLPEWFTADRKVYAETLERGRERFNVFCAVCHDARGTGDGIVVQRGYTKPPTYHDERLRSAPDGYFFDVITHGYGSMPDYAPQVPVADRWAIVAYVRVLQQAEYTKLGELPGDQRQAILGKLNAENKRGP